MDLQGPRFMLSSSHSNTGPYGSHGAGKMDRILEFDKETGINIKTWNIIEVAHKLLIKSLGCSSFRLSVCKGCFDLMSKCEHYNEDNFRSKLPWKQKVQ